MCGGFLIIEMNKEELKEIIDNMYLEGEKAIEEGEIPVSCCLVLSDGRRIYGHNSVEKENNPFSHAEFNAINKALTDTKYIKGSHLIVSMEPCLLCMGAILKAGIGELTYIIRDEKRGAISYYHTFVDKEIKVNELTDERFDKQLKRFFTGLREKNK